METTGTLGLDLFLDVLKMLLLLNLTMIPKWAFVLLLLESSFTADELKKFQEAYSLKLPVPKKDGSHNLALMDIKQAKHTKGYIRRNNIQNWKVCIVFAFHFRTDFY
jgi:hypothetical protein